MIMEARGIKVTLTTCTTSRASREEGSRGEGRRRDTEDLLDQGLYVN